MRFLLMAMRADIVDGIDIRLMILTIRISGIYHVAALQVFVSHRRHSLK